MAGHVDELFRMSEVDPTHRSFTLTMKEWSRLCDTYANFCKEYPRLLDYNYRDPNSKRFMEETVPVSLTDNVSDVK
jgi:hypothetical protein